MRTFAFVFFPWLLRQEKTKSNKKVSFSWCNDDDDDDDEGDDGDVSIDEGAWKPDSAENHFCKASVCLFGNCLSLFFLLFPSHSACHNLVIFFSA